MHEKARDNLNDILCDCWTGQSGLTAVPDCLPCLVLMMFGVKQSDTAQKHRSRGQVYSLCCDAENPHETWVAVKNVVHAMLYCTLAVYTNGYCSYTHRSIGSRAFCTWYDVGLGSHWSLDKNMAWGGWIEAGEGSCFLGHKDTVHKNQDSCVEDYKLEMGHFFVHSLTCMTNRKNIAYLPWCPFSYRLHL